MKNFVKVMDNLPLIVKIILCIPALDIVWAVYRIVKGIAYKQTLTLLFGILWIVPGCVICWLLDLVCTLFYGKPTLFA